MPSLDTQSIEDIYGEIGDQALQGLKAHFGRLERPGKDVIRTPMFKDFDDSEYITLIGRFAVDVPGWLLDFEVKELPKLGPQSPLPPWKDIAKDVIFDVSGDIHFDIDIPTRKRAVQYVLDQFQLSGLRSIGLNVAWQGMVKTTNSGLPWFVRRATIPDLILQDASRRIEQKDARLLAIYGSRAKPQADDDPTRRTVHMWTASLNVIESMVFKPLTTVLKDYPVFATWRGIPKLDSVIHFMLSNRGNGGTFLSGDYSGFDNHISVWKIIEVLNIVKTWFSEDDHHLVELAFESNIGSKLLTPSGVFGNEHRVKSGWGGTNLVDSLINIIDCVYALMLLDQPVPKLNRRSAPAMVVNGDDFSVRIQETMSIEDFAKAISSTGSVLHPSKQIVSADLIALNSRYSHTSFQEGRVSVRPFARFGLGYRWPERPMRQGPQAESLAAIMRLHTIETHPNFLDFLPLAIMGDKQFGLGTRLEGGVDQLVHSNPEWQPPNESWKASNPTEGINSWVVINELRKGFR